MKTGWRKFYKKSTAKRFQKEASKTHVVPRKIVKETTYNVMVGMKKKKIR